MDKYFILYSSCIPTKGIKRSVIHDLQRKEIQFIPNDLYDFLVECNKMLVSEIYSKYNKYHDIIKGYIDFLLDKEYGFLGSYEDTLIMDSMDYSYSYPGVISNSIIELSAKNLNSLKNIIPQLNDLKCNSLQFVSYELNLNIDSLKKIISEVNNTSYLKNIQFIIKYNQKFTLEQVVSFCKQNLIISELTLHSSPFDKIKNFKNGSIINFTQKKILNQKYCGVINQANFCLNKAQIIESRNFNSCLHKKIAIDSKGNIKNCPSMLQSFGNISNTRLKEAIEYKDYKKFWNVTKDKIDKCKSCEFRYICTDCRAYTEVPEKDFSKPLKCGYDPSTNEWEEWSTNSLKKRAIQYYDMQELTSKND